MRGPSAFTELHLLAQMLWRPGKTTGSDMIRYAHWIDATTVAELTRVGTYKDDFFQTVVSYGRYLSLAQKNTDHFHPDAWTAFEKEFRPAMVALHDHVTAKTSPHPIPADSIARLAYGLHLFTDAFSSGHMRVPRAKAGLGALIMHDIDGRLGLNVKNGFGDKWRAFGDGKLRGPDDLGKLILTLLKKSGIDTNPLANLDIARAAVGAAVKQLHYHAQRHRTRAGTDHVHKVLDANRGTSTERLRNEEWCPMGKPGPGKDVAAWIDMNLDDRMAHLRNYMPVPYPVGPNWDTKAENHSMLFDANGNVSGKGFEWATDWSSLNENRKIKNSLPGVSMLEFDVNDATELYQAVINAPSQAATWAPDGSKVVELFDKLPEDVWD